MFDEFGNACWHYHVTGSALEEIFEKVRNEKSKFAAYVSATGSAGTIAAGDYLRTKFPHLKVVASEALQCPTILMNGFGGHRIEGIGDKHVPWIHNVKNTNVVSAIDDEKCMRLLRLFNEDIGQDYLKSQNVSEKTIGELNLLGISSIANVLAAIKTAKLFELNSDDIIFTVATDSSDLYKSRIEELKEKHGDYNKENAARDLEAGLFSTTPDYTKELTYLDQKAIHNLKYYTWIEQQGKELEDLNQLWYDREVWQKIFEQPKRWDELINEFNAEVG